MAPNLYPGNHNTRCASELTLMGLEGSPSNARILKLSCQKSSMTTSLGSRAGTLLDLDTYCNPEMLNLKINDSSNDVSGE